MVRYDRLLMQGCLPFLVELLMPSGNPLSWLHLIPIFSQKLTSWHHYSKCCNCEKKKIFLSAVLWLWREEYLGSQEPRNTTVTLQNELYTIGFLGVKNQWHLNSLKYAINFATIFKSSTQHLWGTLGFNYWYLVVEFYVTPSYSLVVTGTFCHSC